MNVTKKVFSVALLSLTFSCSHQIKKHENKQAHRKQIEHESHPNGWENILERKILRTVSPSLAKPKRNTASVKKKISKKMVASRSNVKKILKDELRYSDKDIAKFPKDFMDYLLKVSKDPFGEVLFHDGPLPISINYSEGEKIVETIVRNFVDISSDQARKDFYLGMKKHDLDKLFQGAPKPKQGVWKYRLNQFQLAIYNMVLYGLGNKVDTAKFMIEVAIKEFPQLNLKSFDSMFPPILLLKDRQVVLDAMRGVSLEDSRPENLMVFFEFVITKRLDSLMSPEYPMLGNLGSVRGELYDSLLPKIWEKVQNENFNASIRKSIEKMLISRTSKELKKLKSGVCNKKNGCKRALGDNKFLQASLKLAGEDESFAEFVYPVIGKV